MTNKHAKILIIIALNILYTTSYLLAEKCGTNKYCKSDGNN